MNNLKYIRAQKDHLHFTNECCECCKSKDDKDMLPVWANRLSGLIPKEYLEPDYICKTCYDLKVNELGDN